MQSAEDFALSLTQLFQGATKRTCMVPFQCLETVFFFLAVGNAHINAYVLSF